jgi:transcriptional regulator NrdR family protein
MITVIKRDKTQEEWSDDKLITSLIRCGINSKDSSEIVEKVKKNYKNDTFVDSSDIKSKTTEVINLTHPENALLYANFQK